MKKTLSFLLCLLALLTLTLSAVSASADADAYIAAVKAASELPTLAERETALAAARELRPEEGYETYPGMAEADAAAKAIEDAVTACKDYVNATYALRDLEVYAAYSERRAVYDEERRLFALADMSYPGVSDCYDSVKAILAEFQELESFMQDYATAVSRLESAVTYSQIDTALRNVQRLASLDAFIPDHPIAIGAEEKLSAAGARMEALSATAAEFVVAVQEMAGMNSLYEGLSYALPYYLAADGTVSGISDIYGVFTFELESYNGAVAALNAAVRGE